MYFFALLCWLSVVKLNSWPFLLTGLIAGFAAGLLQSLSISEAPRTFLGARTSLDVRRAIAATRYGRFYLPLFWTFHLALIGAAIAAHQTPAILSGYLAFAFLRESASLPAVGLLERMHKEGITGNQR